MTFIETQEGWLYLAGVIDAYARKIVGWAMGQQHDAELVKRALQMALIQRQPAWCITLIEEANMRAKAIKRCCKTMVFRSA